MQHLEVSGAVRHIYICCSAAKGYLCMLRVELYEQLDDLVSVSEMVTHFNCLTCLSVQDVKECSCHDNSGQVTSLVYASSKRVSIWHTPMASTHN